MINPVNLKNYPLPTSSKDPTLQQQKESLRHISFVSSVLHVPSKRAFPSPLPLPPKSHITLTALIFFLKCARCPLLYLPLDFQTHLPVFLPTARKLKEDPTPSPMCLHSIHADSCPKLPKHNRVAR